jgi:dCMP deaminase
MKHNMMIKILKAVADESTCARLKVGSILVKNTRVLSHGFNGVPSGLEHCEDQDWTGRDHHRWSHENEIHSELNSIAYAARQGIATDGCILYTTHSPCLNCAKAIAAAGITVVYYLEEYDREDSLDFLKRCGIKTYKLNDNTKPA